MVPLYSCSVLCFVLFKLTGPVDLCCIITHTAYHSTSPYCTYVPVLVKGVRLLYVVPVRVQYKCKVLVVTLLLLVLYNVLYVRPYEYLYSDCTQQVPVRTAYEYCTRTYRYERTASRLLPTGTYMYNTSVIIIDERLSVIVVGVRYL